MIRPVRLQLRNAPKSGQTSLLSPYPLSPPQPIVAAAEKPFSPDQLSTPLITWFGKQDSDISYTSGNPTGWLNQGTDGGTATLTSATAMTQNGRAAVRLGYYGNGQFTQTFTTLPRTTFLVTKYLSGTLPGYWFMIQQQPASGGNWAWVMIPAGGGDYNINYYAQGVAGPLTARTSVSPSSAVHIYSATNSLTIAKNSMGVDDVSLTLTTSDRAQSYYLGSTSTYLNASGGAGLYCEVLCYDGELSAADTAKVIAYLQTKWGL